MTYLIENQFLFSLNNSVIFVKHNIVYIIFNYIIYIILFNSKEYKSQKGMLDS